MAGSTDQHHTHTQKVVFFILAIHTDWGTRRIKVHMYAFCLFCCWSVFFVFVLVFLSGMSSRTRWLWSDLVHAYPQNERKVLLALLFSSLFPQPRPSWGRGRLRLYKTDGVSFFLSLSTHRGRATSLTAFLGLVWSVRDDSGCMLCLLLLRRGSRYQAHCFCAACNV